MSKEPQTNRNGREEAAPLYREMEERMLLRDQEGGSRLYCELLKRGRPFEEIMAEAVRIHAPYTHVPYHQRIDDGFPNFVNNDHCLLSSRAAINLRRMVGPRFADLPLAQTIWYIPSGLDIWNQKILKAPGHYANRGYKVTNAPPLPIAPWPDQQPLHLQGPLAERLNHWLTLVERGQVIDAYRVFLGLIEESEHRGEVLAQLVFAGMIDVQDRMLYNRSYTTGHTAYRARSVVEIGNAIGWDKAHDTIYAGALDIAVGPRWHSVYEMACNVVLVFIDGEEIHAVPHGGASGRERDILANNKGTLDAAETRSLIEALTEQREPAYIECISALLNAGKAPRRIIDAIQLAAAKVVLETEGAASFSMPQHTYEYCNTLGWFYDNFAHPQRLKLLYVAGSMVNQAAWHQRGLGWRADRSPAAPAGAGRLAGPAVIARLEAALAALDSAASVAWTQAYLDSGADRAPLVESLALMAARIGNDPHNQEIPQCLLEDWQKNQNPGRDLLLLACAHITAGHRKYGDPFEASRRFGERMGLAELQ
jgi:hypothetical protein